MSSNKGEIREMIIGLQIDKCRNKMIGNTDCEPKDIAATCLKSIQEELQTRKRRIFTIYIDVHGKDIKLLEYNVCKKKCTSLLQFKDEKLMAITKAISEVLKDY